MELIDFIPGQRPSGFHGITVNGNYFNAVVSGSLSNALGKNKILIHRDKNRPEDWYISLNEKGYSLSKKRSGCYSISAIRAFREMYKALGLEEGVSYRFMVAQEAIEEDGKKYFAIITKSAKKVT